MQLYVYHVIIFFNFILPGDINVFIEILVFTKNVLVSLVGV